jgi:GNAT superfamily N-acetyltransferase
MAEAKGDRIRVRELTSARDPAFDAAYRLLRRTFPAAELLPKRDWQVVMRESEADLWTDINWHLFVAEWGGKVVGSASGSYLGNVNVGVIGYIAVDPRERAAGLGPRLRRKLVEAFVEDANDVRGEPLLAVAGEVEEDNPWLRHLAKHLRAIPLDFPYLQPALGVAPAAVPLVLYWQPISDHRRSLPASEVRRLLYTIWRRMYRVSAPLERPPFRKMMRALRGRRLIGSRELTRLPKRPAKLPAKGKIKPKVRKERSGPGGLE